MPLEQWKPKGKGKISWQGESGEIPETVFSPFVTLF